MITYIQLRGNCYYVRLSVPKELRSHFNKREFKQTLNTSDVNIAKPKAMQLISHWKYQFEALKVSLKAHGQLVSHICNEPIDEKVADPNTGMTAKDYYVEHVAEHHEMDEKQKKFREHIFTGNWSGRNACTYNSAGS